MAHFITRHQVVHALPFDAEAINECRFADGKKCTTCAKTKALKQIDRVGTDATDARQ